MSLLDDLPAVVPGRRWRDRSGVVHLTCCKEATYLRSCYNRFTPCNLWVATGDVCEILRSYEVDGTDDVVTCFGCLGV